MDEADIDILNELRVNARITNRKLAEKVHLSPSAVLERVKRLRASGVLKEFVARIDNSAAGYNLEVFIELKLERNLRGDSITKALIEFPEILEIHDVAGDCDYILKVVARDSNALRDTMRRIGAIPGVLSSNTKLVLGTFKSELSPFIEKTDRNSGK